MSKVPHGSGADPIRVDSVNCNARTYSKARPDRAFQLAFSGAYIVAEDVQYSPKG